MRLVVFGVRHLTAGESMAQVVQVEIRTGTTHTMTWLDAALKLKPGMVLVCKGDPRRWSVVHAYITTQEVRNNNIDWKNVSCEAPICAA
jgi:hypothetical protein